MTEVPYYESERYLVDRVRPSLSKFFSALRDVQEVKLGLTELHKEGIRKEIDKLLR